MPTEIADQNFENIPFEEEKIANKKVAGKPIFIFAGIFGGLLVILLSMAIFFSLQQGKIMPNTKSTPTPTPTLEIKEEITAPSPYATDSAVLKMEEEIKNLDQQITSADLKEAGLNPPVLEMNIKFEK